MNDEALFHVMWFKFMVYICSCDEAGLITGLIGSDVHVLQ